MSPFLSSLSLWLRADDSPIDTKYDLHVCVLGAIEKGGRHVQVAQGARGNHQGLEMLGDESEGGRAGIGEGMSAYSRLETIDIEEYMYRSNNTARVRLTIPSSYEDSLWLREPITRLFKAEFELWQRWWMTYPADSFSVLAIYTLL